MFDEYLCPHCVTPWKCNGPHIAIGQPHPVDCSECGPDCCSDSHPCSECQSDAAALTDAAARYAGTDWRAISAPID